MIVDLTASTPAENLPAMIDFVIGQFQPDSWALRVLHDACAKRCSAEQCST